MLARTEYQTTLSKMPQLMKEYQQTLHQNSLKSQSSLNEKYALTDIALLSMVHIGLDAAKIKPPYRKIMHVNCGNGSVGLQLSLSGFEVVVTSSSLNTNSATYTQLQTSFCGFPFLSWENEKIYYPSESLDVIIFSENPSLCAFQEGARMLKPNGLMIIAAPSCAPMLPAWLSEAFQYKMMLQKASMDKHLVAYLLKTSHHYVE